MTGGHDSGPIHVVAAAVTDAKGRILIAQRPEGKHLAGGWEFSGGKIEPGETRVQALSRELQEELGITLTAHPRPLLRLRHTYPYGEVLLDMWVVSRYRGEPRGMDGQPIRWCTQEELEAATELLPADQPVVRALRLPERLVNAINQHIVVMQTLSDVDSAQVGSGRSLVLRGRLCLGPAEKLSVSRMPAYCDGADFLVMGVAVPDGQLQIICDLVTMPVYARGISMEAAVHLGATGISELCV